MNSRHVNHTPLALSTQRRGDDDAKSEMSLPRYVQTLLHKCRGMRLLIGVVVLIATYMMYSYYLLLNSPMEPVPLAQSVPVFFEESVNSLTTTETTSIQALWDVTMNSQWQYWSGLGYCHNGSSLLESIPNTVCERVECLYSDTLQVNIDLSKLREDSFQSLNQSRFFKQPTFERYQSMLWRGDPSRCSRLTGGQRPVASTERDKVETSFVLQLDRESHSTISHDGVDALLEMFRTARETSSAEFIIAVSKEVRISRPLFRMIQNFHELFGVAVVEVPCHFPKSSAQFDEEIARHASGQFIALVNHDALVLPGWLALSLHTMRSFPRTANDRIGAVGGMVVDVQGRVLSAGGVISRDGSARFVGKGLFSPRKFAQLHARSVDFLSCASVLLRREAILRHWVFRGSSTSKGDDGANQLTPTNDALAGSIRRTRGLGDRGWKTILQPLAAVVHMNTELYTHEIPASLSNVTTIATSTARYCPSPLSKMAGPVPEYPEEFMLQLAEAAMFYREPRRVLVLEDVIPETDRDAGSIRLYELLHILMELGLSVSFEQQPFVRRDIRYLLPLLADGVNMLMPGTLHDMAKGAAHGLFQSVRDYTMLDPNREQTVCPWDLLIIARRDVFDRHWQDVQQLCPKIPIIFDTVDVHFIRELRFFRTKHGDKQVVVAGTNEDPIVTGKRPLDVLSLLEADISVQQDLTKLLASQEKELSFMRNSQITLVVSTTEQEILRRLFENKVDVRIVSNIYSVDDDEQDIPPSLREGAVFAGNMCHPPNVDAVEFIMSSILKYPDFLPKGFKMHFVWSRSAVCPHPILPIAEAHPMVVVHRDISNADLLRLHRQAKVVLAPLRYGAGVKGKVNYGLLHGIPVIATKIASEGMGLKSEVNFLLAESGEDFIRAIRRMYEDDLLFRTIAKGGKDIMRRMFGRDVAKKRISDAITDLGIFANKQSNSAERERCPFVDIFEHQRTGQWDRFWLTDKGGELFFPLYPRVSYDNMGYLNHWP